MNDILASISNREFAALFWLSAFLILVLSREKSREPLQNVLRTFFKPVIVIPLLLAAIYAAGEIALLSHFGWWSPANLKTTLVWVITFAFVSMFEVLSAKDRKAGLGRITGEILTVTVALTFIVELHNFSLPIELIALPLVTMLVLMAEVAKHKPKHADAPKLLDALAALIGLGYFGFSLWMSYVSWQETATWANALEFLIPLLLSLGFLPFLYVWIIYVTYNDVLTGISIIGLDKNLLSRARWLAITRIRTDLDLLERWRRVIQQTKPSNREELDHSLTALLALREREASPPVVPPQDGWSPYLAMQFLTDRSFDTGHYHHSFDDEWYASTPMREFGIGAVMPDNLAYYVEGSEHAASTLKLKLNINNPASAEAAETWFIVCCLELLEQSISLDAVERMMLSIAQLDDFQEKIPFGSVSLRREDYVGGIPGGYSRYFEIKRGLP